MTAQIKAVPGKAVITIKDMNRTTDSGLVIPETVDGEGTVGIVVDSQIPDVEAGDTVLLLSKYVGSGFEIDGREYVTVVPDEILGVVVED